MSIINNHRIHQRSRTQSLCTQLPQITQHLAKIPCILNLDPQILLMVLIVPCQITHMLKVACLSAHPYSHLQVEQKLIGVCVSTRLGLDECVKVQDVFELCVGV